MNENSEVNGNQDQPEQGQVPRLRPKNTGNKKGFNYRLIFSPAVDTLAYIGALSVVVLILYTFADVVGRTLFSNPMPGTYEVTQICMAVAAGTGVFYTSVRMGHIIVDIITIRFPQSVQRMIFIIRSWLSFLFWSATAYEVYIYGIDKIKTHGITGLLKIPLPPFIFILATGFLLYAITELIHALRPDVSREGAGTDL